MIIGFIALTNGRMEFVELRRECIHSMLWQLMKLKIELWCIYIKIKEIKRIFYLHSMYNNFKDNFLLPETHIVSPFII